MDAKHTIDGRRPASSFEAGPRPIHRAIDLLTAAEIALDRVRLAARESSLPADALTPDLDRLAARLRELAEALTEARDEPTAVDPAAP